MSTTFPTTIDSFALVPAAGKAVPYDDYAKLQDGLVAVETGLWTPTSYTPTWTNGVLNNGTITGKYYRRGSLVRVEIHLIMGSTTTYGAGAEWTFSLPVTAVDVNGAVGASWVVDASPGVYYIGGVSLASITAVRATVSGASSGYTSAVPHTWAQNDTMRITIEYRV